MNKYLTVTLPFVMLCAGAIAEVPSNYTVVSNIITPKQGQQSGPCDGTMFHVKNNLSGKVRAIYIPEPCKVVNFSHENNENPTNWSAYNSYQISRQSSYTKQSTTHWHYVNRTGDCNVMTFNFVNVTTNRDKKFTINNACTKINFYHDRVKKHHSALTSQVLAFFNEKTNLGCDIIVNDSDSLERGLKSVPNYPTDNNGYLICLESGEYGPVRIDGKNNLTLLAINGMANFSATIPYTDDSLTTATFEISSSNNVELVNLNVTNDHEFRELNDDGEPGNTKQQVSRAMYISDSNNIGFHYGNISGRGKQTVNVDNSYVTMNNTSISCYYFCIDSSYSNVNTANLSLYVSHAERSGDTHSVLWTDFSDYYLKNTTVIAKSGKGLVSGSAFPDRNKIIVEGFVEAQGNLEGWVQNHPNYYGIKLYLMESANSFYPKHLADFYDSRYQGGGDSFNNQVLRMKAN
ncbi:hypothetical protein [Pseudoalteromonas sp. PPB1]|uniref:hypothetical protein n=1 Tax=Pseudoalteromonas sp. PPB1 TaxID=2756136 RepID=UPI001891D741|nr:hypothetical protein [Pseudoalteromonas sp. PPB1]